MTNELINAQPNNLLSPEQEVLNAHAYLKNFLEKFEHAKRGGIHDFIEIAIFKMIHSSIKNSDLELDPENEQDCVIQIINLDTFIFSNHS